MWNSGAGAVSVRGEAAAQLGGVGEFGVGGGDLATTDHQVPLLRQPLVVPAGLRERRWPGREVDVEGRRGGGGLDEAVVELQQDLLGLRAGTHRHLVPLGE
jgi:hypothetical protein